MTMRTTKTLTATASALALALGLAACGSSGPADPAADSSSPTMWALTGSSEDIFRSSVERWNEENPDASINQEFFANDAYKTKVRTAIGAGEGPSFIYGWGGGVLKSYVDAGHVEELDDFLAENPEIKDRYIPSVFENGVIDGTTYALPNNNMQPVVLYYNKQVFEQIGAEPPETWDELMALVPKFNDAGIAPFALAGQSKWPNLMWLSYLVDRIGGPEVFQAILDGEEDAWSDPAVIEALTKIQDLVDAGGFVNGFSSIAADAGADSALLYTDRAAMMVHGGWVYQNLKNDAPEFVESGEVGFVPFPAVEGGAGDPANVVGNPANMWSLSSTASDEQKEVAFEYLKDGLFSEEYTQAMIDSGAVPAVNGIEDQLAASDDKDFVEFVYGLAQDAPSFQLSWDQALSPAQGDAMLANLDQIFIGKITPEQFAENMNATLGK
ncbi:sugar ABC transporter substrate-binding protein [Arthrobacter pityocampae]|uniref:Sugar ABC transporter substrate-binding protein n=1 Tax=Arthrobacter pityocampae TaxID=547334 RepID=A0A2S5IUS9_9MICC|nr:extracellular solute-binding protein [Arthrobacter pityocampae]PPB48314.1 sugar ABC transporter substrate-binding protein [Arthrobacter pityocampae]